MKSLDEINNSAPLFEMDEVTNPLTKEEAEKLVKYGYLTSRTMEVKGSLIVLMKDIEHALRRNRSEDYDDLLNKALNFNSSQEFKALFDHCFLKTEFDMDDPFNDEGGYFISNLKNNSGDGYLDCNLEIALKELINLYSKNGFVMLRKFCSVLGVESHHAVIEKLKNVRRELQADEDILEYSLDDENGFSAGELEEDKTFEGESFLLVEGQPELKVFDFNNIKHVVDGLERSYRSRHKLNLEKILSTENESRNLAQVNEHIAANVRELKKDFPNFTDVVDYYLGEIALSLCDEEKVFYARPILLAGPPGVGKTVFGMKLAKVIGTVFKALNLGATTAGFVISGNSHQWDGSSSGIVLTCLRDNGFANPIIFLDELDKARGDFRYDPCSCLLSLLERQTAKTFIDESIEEEIDASHVVWIATANYLENIPEPIKSRFMIFNIEKVEGQKAKDVVRSIWKSLRLESRWGESFSERLDEEVLKKLSGEVPRKVKESLNHVCGRIALSRSLQKGERHQVTVFDLYEMRKVSATHNAMH